MSHLQTIPKHDGDLPSLTTSLTDEDTTMEKLTSGAALTVSDGGSALEKGSFGFVLSTRQGERLAACEGPVHAFTPSSHRSEIHGVLAVVRFIHSMSTPNGMHFHL